MRKYFILDTNVLLHNAESIEAFADNVVVLPMTVIEELDKFKSGSDELGRNARHVIRRLDALREKGRLGEGVPMENGGILKIETAQDKDVPVSLDVSIADNRILRVAYRLHKEGEKVIFVSKDINARLKADALGIEVQDFEKQKVNFDELFQGYRDVAVSKELVDAFFRNKSKPTTVQGSELLPNEFVVLVDEGNPKHTALARAVGSDAVVHL